MQAEDRQTQEMLVYRDPGLSSPSVVGRIMTPKEGHFLIPRTCGYVTLGAQRDLAGGIRLWILRWRDDPGLFWRAQRHHRGPYTWKREAIREAVMGAGSGRCCPSGLEEGAMSGGMWVARKCQETDSPQGPPEGTSPANTLLAAH